jgi:hypothetical protein
MKKAHSRFLAVATVQNVLMHKMGLATQAQVETTDFDCYFDLFKEGLFEEHVMMMIQEVFMERALVIGGRRVGGGKRVIRFRCSRSQRRSPRSSMGNDNMLVWNVQGLNSRARRDTVRELVVEERPTLVCLQETKLHVINDFDLLQILGHGFDYIYPPSVNTSGGILVSWKASPWLVSNPSMGAYSVPTKLRHTIGGSDWWLTSVYGTTTDAGKPAFLEELCELRSNRDGPWLLNCDFNMIYRATYKNNDRLDHRRMGQF